MKTDPVLPRRLSSSDLPCSPGQVENFLSAPTEQTIETLRDRRGPFLVLGAGGKMGLHLSAMLRRALKRLGRKGPVIAVSRFRTLRDHDDFTALGVKTLACDLEDVDAVARLPDAPTVFFLAGVKFGTAGASDLLRRVNAEMPRQVAERYRRATTVAFSTGCVYPFVTPASGGATEATPPEPNGEYAASCLARERAFESVSRESGAKVVLFRLNYSVEFRYGLLVDVALKVARGEPVDVTTGYANVIWQTDTINYAIQSLALADAPAVPINVTGPEIISIRDIARQFGELFGRTVQIQGEEAPTAWLNNASKLHQRFGPPATSLDSMMQWVATWVGAGNEVWNKPTGFERRDGRF